MSVDKLPSGRFRVRVKHGGRVVATKSFDRKGDAERWEAEQKRQLDLGVFVPPARGKVTVGQLADQWLEARAHSVSSKTLETESGMMRLHLPATLRNRAIGTVRTPDLDALWLALLGKGLSRSTVCRVREAVSSLFAYAVRQQLLASNPVKESVVPRGTGQDAKREIYPFNLAELRAVYAAIAKARPDLADTVLVLGLTGLRFGELVALRVRDVQELPYPAFRVSRSAPAGHAVRTTTKGGKARTVPLAAELVEIVRARAEGKDPDAFLFTSPQGARLDLRNWRVQVEWAKHAKGRRPHDLRHTAATLWLGNGVDLKTAQTWLGHADAAMTANTYAHYLGSDADTAAIARMNVALAGVTTGSRVTNLRAATSAPTA